ncbi:tyrosine-type recombinase/integrase [Streptomyces sp. CNQ085]|uniref:site-specific integrase n=1 Tax=Streptomyces sp. CNQ085 TaxID=2886944 RepID=UPI0035B01EB4
MLPSTNCGRRGCRRRRSAGNSGCTNAARQDWDKTAKVSKPVCTAPTEEAALERFAETRGRKYPTLTVLCRNANARRVRVHDLRHTCASLLLAQGVDARTIMETLGHSTITMTLDTYAHVMDTTLRAAAERMEDVLGPEDGGEGDNVARPPE